MKTFNCKQLVLFLAVLFAVGNVSFAQSGYAPKTSAKKSNQYKKKQQNNYGYKKKATGSNTYRYSKSLASSTKGAIISNPSIKNIIRNMQRYGVSQNNFIETSAIIFATDKTQLLLMTKAGMTELYKGKYINKYEHGILMNMLHKDGYSKHHYAEYYKYRKYSTDVAKHIFMNLKDHCPKVDYGKRYKVKRGDRFRNQMLKIILGSFTATDDLARVKRMRKGYEAYTFGYSVAEKMLKKVNFNYNHRNQNDYGFKPAPNGQGDGSYQSSSKLPWPVGGWPWKM